MIELNKQNCRHLLPVLEAQIQSTHERLARCPYLSCDWIETNGRLLELEIQLERVQARYTQLKRRD